MNTDNFKFDISVPVRFSDVDAMGHVNNAKYLTYFEEARVGYFRHVLSLSESTTAKLGMIVLEARCRYKSPAYFGEIMKVHTRVSWMRNKSFEMEYFITDAASGRIVAEGSSVQVAFDYSIRQTTEIPEEQREKIAAFEGIENRKKE